MNHFLKAFLLAGFISSMVCSEQAPSPVVPRPDWGYNSALFYWRAIFFVLENPDFLKWANDALAHVHHNKFDPLPAEAAQEDSPALKCLLAGADLPGGDFGTRQAMEAMGLRTLQAEIRTTKDLATLCSLRARWRFEHGRNREAIKDCMAMIALGADLTRNSSTMDSLVGLTIQSMAQGVLQHYLPRCGVEDCLFAATTMVDARHTRLPLAEACANEVSNVIKAIVHLTEDDAKIFYASQGNPAPLPVSQSNHNGLPTTDSNVPGTSGTYVAGGVDIAAGKVSSSAGAPQPHDTTKNEYDESFRQVLAATTQQRQQWCDEAFAPFAGFARFADMPDDQYATEMALFQKMQPLVGGNPLTVERDNFIPVCTLMQDQDRCGRIRTEFLARVAKAIHEPAGVMGLQGSMVRSKVVHLTKTGESISYRIGEDMNKRGYCGTIGDPLPEAKPTTPSSSAQPVPATLHPGDDKAP